MSEQQNQRDAEADLAVCAAATPGPWELCNDMAYGIGCDYIWAAVGSGGQIALLGGPVNGEECDDPELIFAAAAREALPWWIAEAERLRAEPSPTARLEAWVERSPGEPGYRRYEIGPWRGVYLDAHDCMNYQQAQAVTVNRGAVVVGHHAVAICAAGTTLDEMILAALRKWEELYGKEVQT